MQCACVAGPYMLSQKYVLPKQFWVFFVGYRFFVSHKGNLMARHPSSKTSGDVAMMTFSEVLNQILKMLDTSGYKSFFHLDSFDISSYLFGYRVNNWKFASQPQSHSVSLSRLQFSVADLPRGGRRSKVANFT